MPTAPRQHARPGEPTPCRGCGRTTRALGKLCPTCSKIEEARVAALPPNAQGPKVLRDLFRF